MNLQAGEPYLKELKGYKSQEKMQSTLLILSRIKNDPFTFIFIVC